ncbi:hypothetical protein MMC16_006626 [Acarospora aff. strigata]|nr:hypothetical protein [Acarospora aff. strigata]
MLSPIIWRYWTKAGIAAERTKEEWTTGERVTEGTLEQKGHSRALIDQLLIRIYIEFQPLAPSAFDILITFSKHSEILHQTLTYEQVGEIVAEPLVEEGMIPLAFDLEVTPISNTLAIAYSLAVYMRLRSSCGHSGGAQEEELSYRKKRFRYEPGRGNSYYHEFDVSAEFAVEADLCGPLPLDLFQH